MGCLDFIGDASLGVCPFTALFVVHQRYPSAGDAEVVVRIVSADLYLWCGLTFERGMSEKRFLSIHADAQGAGLDDQARLLSRRTVEWICSVGV